MAANFVKMKYSKGKSEAVIDVHLSQVENMKRTGWKEITDKKPVVNKSEISEKG